MKRNRSAETRTDHMVPAQVGRRGFLRKAGLGSVGMLAVAGMGEVLRSPAANASTRTTSGQKVAGHFTVIDKADAKPGICTGESRCYPCSGCCGNPCTPTGIAYCFYCTGSCGQGVACYDHSPVDWTNCCH